MIVAPHVKCTLPRATCGMMFSPSLFVLQSVVMLNINRFEVANRSSVVVRVRQGAVVGHDVCRFEITNGRGIGRVRQRAILSGLR